MIDAEARTKPRALGRLASSVGVVLLCAPWASSQSVNLEYTVTDAPGPGGQPGFWDVRLALSGLDASVRTLEFEVPSPRSAGASYLEVVSSSAPMGSALTDGSRLRMELPPDRTGSARLAYRIRVAKRGSEQQRRDQQRPSRGDGYAFGYARSVLVRPWLEHHPLEASVAVELIASRADGGIVSGWEGLASGRQRVHPDVPWGNSPIAFGRPVRWVKSVDVASSLRVECYQFGRGRPVCDRVHGLLSRMAPQVSRFTGVPPRLPLRAFMTDAMGGGMGSEYGLHLGVHADDLQTSGHDALFATVLAHEMLHEWLGMRLEPDDNSLVWFHEGFTEYFALWLVAASGVASRVTFAETLDEYERFARSSTSFGARSFVDPAIEWRDGDGPNELMAYRGAPVLALSMDVALRASGQRGLLQLLRDLLARDSGVYSRSDLRSWFFERGLGALWERAVAGTEVATVADSLVRAGFEYELVPVEVAYLGLQTSELGASWRVEAVDPEGPGARAGIEIGDVITGFFPDKGSPTLLRSELDTPYRFGLRRFKPGVEGSFVLLDRAGEELRVAVEPELRRFGLRRAWTAGPGTDAFFSFEPR